MTGTRVQLVEKLGKPGRWFILVSSCLTHDFRRYWLEVQVDKRPKWPQRISLETMAKMRIAQVLPPESITVTYEAWYSEYGKASVKKTYTYEKKGKIVELPLRHL